MADTSTRSGDSEGAEVTLSLELVGQGAESVLPAASAFAAPTYVDEVPYIFHHGAFYMSSGAGEASDQLTKIYSFELRGTNNLQRGPINGSYVLSALVAGKEEITGTAKIVYDAATWNTAVRGATAIGFKAVLTHPLGGTDGVITIRCDDCQVEEAPEEGDPGALAVQTINFSAEKPSSGNQISIVVTDGA